MKVWIKYLLCIVLFAQCAGHDEEIISKSPNLDLKKKDNIRKNYQTSSAQPPVSQSKHSSEVKKRKKRRPQVEMNPYQPRRNVRTPLDSMRIDRITYLRRSNIQLDLNEPLSRDYLLATVPNPQYPSFVQLSNESFFKINFDNDIIDYTDRFYTNGVRFDLVTPILHYSPLSKLLVPYWRSGINYYGICLVQNIYTPSTTKVDTILTGDRPYSAYLYLGSYKITLDHVRHIKQSSEIDLGVIGPSSMGESVQKSFHSGVPPNSEPLGWEYQIQNDFLINYAYAIEKGVINQKYLELIVNGAASLGSLYSNISGGIQVRVGRFNPYFINLGLSKRSRNMALDLKRTQYFFFVTANTKLIGYDASLQGGLFNSNSPYHIPSDELRRVTFQGTAGLSFVQNGFRFDIEQFILTPEYQGGLWHKWVHFGLTFAL